MYDQSLKSRSGQVDLQHCLDLKKAAAELYELVTTEVATLKMDREWPSQLSTSYR